MELPSCALPPVGWPVLLRAGSLNKPSQPSIRADTYGRTPNTACAFRRLLEPLGKGAPSTNRSGFNHPGWARAPLPTTICSPQQNLSNSSPEILTHTQGLDKTCSLGNQTMFHITPKSDQKLSCHSHNANPPQPLATISKSLIKPLSEFALRLISQPTPTDLNQ